MVLQRGNTGDDVKALQQQLNVAGYNLDVDGSFGPKTQAAVKDYQAKNGLAVDGYVGAQTSASLAGLTAKPAAPAQTSPANPSPSKWDNTDYNAAAREAAAAGNWDAVNAALNTRDQKIADTGNNYGTTSYQIYQDLINEYGGPQSQQNAQLESLIDEYKNLYSKQNNAYAEALAEQQRAKQAAVDQAIGSLNSQKQNTEASYADMFRQLYLNKMQNQKNIDQRMAAAGQTGGQAESTLLGLATGYEDALREGGISKQAALSSLDQAIADAQLSGNISAAEDAAAMAQRQADNYAGVLSDLINRADNLVQKDNAQAADNKSYAYQTAMALLQSGNMASDELLADAGIGKADAASIVAGAKAAAQKAKSTSAATPKATQQQAEVAFSAIQQGMDTPANRAVLESYYGLPYQTIAAAFGIKNEPAAPKVDVTSLDFQPDEGIFTWNGKNYNNLVDLAEAIDSANLNAQQKAVLQNKFRAYGFDIQF